MTKNLFFKGLAFILAAFSLLFSAAIAARFAQENHTSELDEIFQAGKKVFFTELELSLGLHPSEFSLRPPNLEKIRQAQTEIPFLYENLVNILFIQESLPFRTLREKGDLESFRTKYFKLCRKAAGYFVNSLFCEGRATKNFLQLPPNRGRDRLELVLASLGQSGIPQKVTADLPRQKMGDVQKSWAFRLTKFKEAHKLTKGKGVKVAIIDSGMDPAAEKVIGANINHDFDFCLAGRKLAPWKDEKVALKDELGQGTALASVVSAFAPEAEIRIYKVSYLPHPPYEFWPATQIAQAIFKAVSDRNDVIVTGASFSSNFDFLKQACRQAYDNNVILVAPSLRLFPENEGTSSVFPAHYNTVIAVAGVMPGPENKPTCCDSSAASPCTAVAAPPSNALAAGVCASLASLIVSRLPKTGTEFPGQYFQRIYEILAKSADPRALGFRSFNPKSGYGLIDAQKAVSSSLETYILKMKKVEEEFKRRMKQRAGQEEEALKKESSKRLREQ